MAKIGTPIDPGPLAELAATCIRRRGTGASRTGRKQHAPAQAWLDASFCNGPAAAAARAAWAALAPWKKYRWLKAAQRAGNPANQIDPHRAGSGFALFIACWLTQTDRTTRLPINPCARRVTDPTASPWDYTP